MIIKFNKEIFESLTKTELDVVNFINDNYKRLPELSIVDIAFETYSSPATVSRAIRKCGIAGFNELRYKSTLSTNDNEIVNINEIMNKSLIEAQRVIEQISLVDVLNIVNAIEKAGRIFVLSMGLTEFVAREFCLKLQLLNYNVFEIHDANIMIKKSMVLEKNDILIIFSLNGKTKEINESAKTAYNKGITIISCCCNDNTELLKYSKFYIIGYKHHHEAIKNYEVASRVPLYMISRIIIDYMSQ